MDQLSYPKHLDVFIAGLPTTLEKCLGDLFFYQQMLADTPADDEVTVSKILQVVSHLRYRHIILENEQSYDCRYYFRLYEQKLPLMIWNDVRRAKYAECILQTEVPLEPDAEEDDDADYDVFEAIIAEKLGLTVQEYRDCPDEQDIEPAPEWYVNQDDIPDKYVVVDSPPHEIQHEPMDTSVPSVSDEEQQVREFDYVVSPTGEKTLDCSTTLDHLQCGEICSPSSVCEAHLHVCEKEQRVVKKTTSSVAMLTNHKHRKHVESTHLNVLLYVWMSMGCTIYSGSDARRISLLAAAGAHVYVGKNFFAVKPTKRKVSSLAGLALLADTKRFLMNTKFSQHGYSPG